MLKRIFGLAARSNRNITAAVYSAIVAAARQPGFYAALGVPDTPLGRYEMLSVHLFLFLHRFKGFGGAEGALAQEVADSFVTDVDDSLRQLGIGDMGIGKRVRKLTRMFYGRAASYGEACEARDRVALAAALHRNILPEAGEWAGAERLADYVLESVEHLAGQPNAAMLSGRIEFLEIEKTGSSLS